MSQNEIEERIRTEMLVRFLYAAEYKPVKTRLIAYCFGMDSDVLERWMRSNGYARLWVECKDQRAWKLRCGVIPPEAVDA